MNMQILSATHRLYRSKKELEVCTYPKGNKDIDIKKVK